MTGALNGLRVADFTQLVQGPNATQFLADYGADIIKIEPRNGEWHRHWTLGDFFLNGEALSFLVFNRGKRSITLNVKDPRGKEAALRIINSADVLIENFRPGVMDRLGLGYETLKQDNPRLIYVASCGWGLSGPYVERPGQDLLAQAVGGVLNLQGLEGDPPSPVGMGVADLTASLHIVIGVLMALYERNKSGVGQRVDINLLNTILSLATQELSVYLNTGVEPMRSRSGMGHPYIGAPMGVYKTKDGYIVIAMMPLGKIAELVGVPGYEGIESRNFLENREEVKRKLEPGFAAKTTAELLEIFLTHDIWCAPVNTFPQVERDPQVVHNGAITSFEHPKAGTFRTIKPPIQFSRTPAQVKRPPLVGEHTAEILKELGYSDNEIATFQSEKVV
ncbi:MAG TPA: CoA transferase [Bryobacteraceae bacterium]|nr:CoA transferase [Bryobacteraceae bacterium]